MGTSRVPANVRLVEVRFPCGSVPLRTESAARKQAHRMLGVERRKIRVGLHYVQCEALGNLSPGFA